MRDIPKLKYHFEAEKGWINDPNGLCFFQGRYHAFFQHNPFGPRWGTMHWGHAVSDDLVHWEELPIALFPDMPYENSLGCFSGSAMEKDGVLYLMYTTVSKERGQTQSIVTTRDGVHFEKYPGNPVISQNPMDPENRDFRDPKIVSWGNEYRMVCGTGVNGLASILLYRSKDLLHWEYMGPIFQSRNYGPVAECPDLFPLGDKWVLVFSRMDESHASQYVVGAFDGEHFTPESFQLAEKGTQFYAAQSFEDPKGRRIVIAWVHDWDEANISDDDVRTGCFSIPREVTLQDGKIRLYPVAEAQGLLTDNDPCLRREERKLQIIHDGKVLFNLPETAVQDVKVLRDTHICEIFINGGEITYTFYF